MYTIAPGSLNSNDYLVFNALEITRESLKKRIANTQKVALDRGYSVKTRILIPKNGVKITKEEFGEHREYAHNEALLLGLCPNHDGFLWLDLKHSAIQNISVLGRV